MPVDVAVCLNSGVSLNRGNAVIMISPNRGITQTRESPIAGPKATIEQFRAKYDNYFDDIRFYCSYSGV